jgi:hypothetical protein
MLRVLDNVLSESELESILHHETVLKNKKTDIKRSNFGFHLDSALIEKLNKTLDIELDPSKELPLVWIKGNTLKHYDRDMNGKKWKSYVIYLTNNEGKFIVQNKKHDIKKGRCFIMEEGVIHETKESDDNLKLSIVINRYGDELF